MNATEKGTSVVSAYRVDPSWICEMNPAVGIGERCVWNGGLRVVVNTV